MTEATHLLAGINLICRRDLQKLTLNFSHLQKVVIKKKQYSQLIVRHKCGLHFNEKRP